MKQNSAISEHTDTSRTQKAAGKPELSTPEPQGTSWQFYFVAAVILIGVLGILGKVLGLF